MALAYEGEPEANNQRTLKDKRLALRMRLHELSAIIHQAQLEYRETIDEITEVSQDLLERRDYHRVVHSTDETGACWECPLYDTADLIPKPVSDEQPTLRAVE